MRTTLNIDDDVLKAAKDGRAGKKRTAGEVVSELLRRALNTAGSSSVVREPSAVYGFRPFPAGDAVVTNARIDELRRDDAY